MKKKIIIPCIFLFLLVSLHFTHVSAATPPDIIHSMVVEITPQPDGSLTMVYSFDYEATTDFPSDIQYLEIGVPNPDFTLQSYTPASLISKGHAKRGSKTSQVHLSFSQLPKAGDRFQFSFAIKQKSMIYKSGEEVSFQFRPGWFDFAAIKEVKVLIDTSGLKQVNMKPTASETASGKAIWVTKNLKPDEKTKLITVTCARSSFPQLANRDIKETPSNSNLFLAAICTLVVLIIAIRLVSKIGRCNFAGGRYIGGDRVGFNLSQNVSSRSGGGGFGGGGCACACACACAGGGRVGCSERGYQVTYWMLRQKHQ